MKRKDAVGDAVTRLFHNDRLIFDAPNRAVKA
jgi:hypothetical protein